MRNADPRILAARIALTEAIRQVRIANGALLTIGPGEPAGPAAQQAQWAIAHVKPWLETARSEARKAPRL